MVTLRVFLTWSHGCFFFFKQKTSYEMRISDWSSSVCARLWAIMAQIAPAFAAEEHTRIVEQAGAVDLSRGGPAGGPIGGDLARLPRAPERPGDGGAAAKESARPGDHPRLVEDVRRVGVVVIPPREDGPRSIDRRVEQNEPGWAKLRLIAKLRRTPLGSGPHTRDDDRENDKDLAD